MIKLEKNVTKIIKNIIFKYNLLKYNIIKTFKNI